MKNHVTLLSFGLAASIASIAHVSHAAPAAPSGAHPRIWLTPATSGAMKAKLGDASSYASKVVAQCDSVIAKPSEMQQAGIEGYNWAYSSLACAAAWQLTGNATYATPAVTLFRAMLDDYQTIGDAAGGDTVVQHDTGYGMRFYAAYSALLYDWLHDAPGVDATLLAHARARFTAWTSWYDASGYLNTTPGSNYHAGYVFAKTLIAIAQANEGGNDAYWSDVVDRIFPQHLIANGLSPKGALAGGDWPEGWQYGTYSTMNYALAARALSEQGVTFPQMTAWADALAVRYAHAMNPAKSGMYVAGDLDSTATDAPLDARPLIATIAGPGSAQGAAWAQSIKTAHQASFDQCLVFDALAEARGAGASDYTQSAPLSYLASGTRNFYARSSWAPDATWTVFTSAPRLVPDHQHFDASNFVLERGADALIVDPTPYGSRSSLTANAMTVESHAVESSYAPSQSPWGAADLPFARMTADGVGGARAELEGAFDGDQTPSDVSLARRDWAFLPEGEVVAIDRVTTNDASRGAYLRFRSPAALATSGDVTSGVVGGSKVAIHAVARSSGAPAVQPVVVGDCWDSNAYGQCAKGRFAVNEYALKLAGPSAFAVHVIDSLGSSESPATVASMTDSGVHGAQIDRAGKRTFVLDGAGGTITSYAAPGDASARHVVFDGAEAADGGASVTATASGGQCQVHISAGGPIAGRPLVFTVTSAADGCKVNGAGPSTGGASGGGSSSGGTSSGSSSGSGSGSGSGAGAGSGDGSGSGPGLANIGVDTSGCSVVPGRATAFGETWRSILGLLGLAWLMSRGRRNATQSDELR